MLQKLKHTTGDIGRFFYTNMFLQHILFFFTPICFYNNFFVLVLHQYVFTTIFYTTLFLQQFFLVFVLHQYIFTTFFCSVYTTMFLQHFFLFFLHQYIFTKIFLHQYMFTTFFCFFTSIRYNIFLHQYVFTTVFYTNMFLQHFLTPTFWRNIGVKIIKNLV